MKVENVNIPGDATYWAMKWRATNPPPFTSYMVQAWCLEQIPREAPKLSDRDIRKAAYRLADRILSKGKQLGLWTCIGRTWEIRT